MGQFQELFLDGNRSFRLRCRRAHYPIIPWPPARPERAAVWESKANEVCLDCCWAGHRSRADKGKLFLNQRGGGKAGGRLAGRTRSGSIRVHDQPAERVRGLDIGSGQTSSAPPSFPERDPIFLRGG